MADTQQRATTKKFATTNSGKGDLVVLDIDTYERHCVKFEFLRLLNEGLDAERSGRTRPFSDAIADIRNELK